MPVSALYTKDTEKQEVNLIGQMWIQCESEERERRNYICPQVLNNPAAEKKINPDMINVTDKW